MVLIDFCASLILIISTFHLSDECSKKDANKSEAPGPSSGNNTSGSPSPDGIVNGPGSTGNPDSPGSPDVPPGVETRPGQPNCVVLPPPQALIDKLNDEEGNTHHDSKKKIDTKLKNPKCRNTWYKYDTGTYMVADFHEGEYNNICRGYTIHGHNDSFEQAEAACKKVGGYPPEITTKKEYENVRELLHHPCRTFVKDKECYRCSEAYFWLQTWNKETCCKAGCPYYLNLRGDQDKHYYWRKSNVMLDTTFHASLPIAVNGSKSCVVDNGGYWENIACNNDLYEYTSGRQVTFCHAVCEKL